jgi:inosose dehydratase
LAWKLAYHANCWGPLGGNPVGVTSVTQLTYKTFGDMAVAARDIAAAGYEGIEFFDGNVLDEAVNGFQPTLKILADTKLKLVALYSGANFIYRDILDDELARIERAADAGATLGAEHLVVGGGARRNGGVREADYDALAKALDQVVRIAESRRLKAHYHPHLSTIVESPEQIRNIFGKTSIGFCPDTAHLTAAGGDAAAIVREHASRISYVHLKGLQRDPFAFTPVGVGDCDNSAVIQALKEIGYPGWVCIELDSWPNPPEAARQSHAFVEAAAKA